MKPKIGIEVSKVEIFESLILVGTEVFSSLYIGCFSLLELTMFDRTFFWKCKPYNISVNWNLILSNQTFSNKLANLLYLRLFKL